MPEGSLSFFGRWSFGTLFGVLGVVVPRGFRESAGGRVSAGGPMVGDSGAVIGD
jgi:hypothetical protein